jgi:hypothetical protein
MVVGHQVAVGRNDEAGTAGHALATARIRHLARISKEATEDFRHLLFAQL